MVGALVKKLLVADNKIIFHVRYIYFEIFLVLYN